ncbi:MULTISPECIES: hypothetical protein [unclassified Streptomyces]|uniref:hypothetical protein n=1 Tax=unclassified Streptomyces TaxID=2593676 RepID=UPI002E2A9AC3|nr:hypothetical protein [Streptomyces sp. NBC_00223]
MSRSSLTSLVAASATAAVIALGAVACGPADDTGSAAPSGSDGSTASAPAKQQDKKPADKPAEKAAFKGSGTYQVGSDVQPGTYRTTGNDDGMCYWERSKDAKGDTDSILANDNVTGSSYVTIKKTDKFFKSTDCKDWFAVTATKSGTPKTKVSGDGMYKVGTDIAPGTYKSTGNADGMCYWERSKDALHGMESITANDNVTGTAIVTVAKSDAYFKSQGCDDWRKTG